MIYHHGLIELNFNQRIGRILRCFWFVLSHLYVAVGIGCRSALCYLKVLKLKELIIGGLLLHGP